MKTTRHNLPSKNNFEKNYLLSFVLDFFKGFQIFTFYFPES